ncbi:hypothetical protein TNCV_726721 [Trichonephila clavipes]|nr:hypothetical protein TNCV_726721 [Trichonephila clavipes]
MMTVVPWGLDSNLREDMEVHKCIVPGVTGGTPNIRQAASPFEWLKEREERWEAPLPPPGCSSKSGWNRDKTLCRLHGAQSYE